MDRIITLGTPHRGFTLLNPLYWAQQIPVIGEWFPLRQVGDLASRSSNIQTLKKNWTDKYISNSPCPPKDNYRYISSIAVAAAYDWVVGTENASGFPAVDIQRYLTERHISVAKANTVISRVTDLIYRELREHLEPQDIMTKIREILADKIKLNNYLTSYAPTIFKIVLPKQLGVAATQKAVNRKTATLLMNFLHEFPQRPLRGLTFDEALVTYAERQP